MELKRKPVHWVYVIQFSNIQPFTNVHILSTIFCFPNIPPSICIYVTLYLCLSTSISILLSLYPVSLSISPLSSISPLAPSLSSLSLSLLLLSTSLFFLSLSHLYPFHSFSYLSPSFFLSIPLRKEILNFRKVRFIWKQFFP